MLPCRLFSFTHTHSSSLVLFSITSYHPVREVGRSKNRWPQGKIMLSSLFPPVRQQRWGEGRWILLTIPEEFPNYVRALLPTYVNQTLAQGPFFHFIHPFSLCLYILQNLAQDHNSQCLCWSLLGRSNLSHLILWSILLVNSSLGLTCCSHLFPLPDCVKSEKQGLDLSSLHTISVS